MGGTAFYILSTSLFFLHASSSRWNNAMEDHPGMQEPDVLKHHIAEIYQSDFVSDAIVSEGNMSTESHEADIMEHHLINIDENVLQANTTISEGRDSTDFDALVEEGSVSSAWDNKFTTQSGSTLVSRVFAGANKNCGQLNTPEGGLTGFCWAKAKASTSKTGIQHEINCLDSFGSQFNTAGTIRVVKHSPLKCVNCRAAGTCDNNAYPGYLIEWMSGAYEIHPTSTSAYQQVGNRLTSGTAKANLKNAFQKIGNKICGSSKKKIVDLQGWVVKATGEFVAADIGSIKDDASGTQCGYVQAAITALR